MDEQGLDGQLETIYSSSVPIRDVAWKTCWEWWTIETSGEKGSGKSVLAARNDDDNIYYSMLFLNVILASWYGKVIVNLISYLMDVLDLKHCCDIFSYFET